MDTERGSVIDAREEFQDDNKFFCLLTGFKDNTNFPIGYRHIMFNRYISIPWNRQFIKDIIIHDIRIANIILQHKYD